MGEEEPEREREKETHLSAVIYVTVHFIAVTLTDKKETKEGETYQTGTLKSFQTE